MVWAPGDTLRLEAGMPLYGHEMDDTISPKEAGLGIFVKMDKDDFIRKQAIQDKGPLTRKRVGLKVTGRHHQGAPACLHRRTAGGMTTSGTHCPFLGYPAAMALVDIGFRIRGQALEVDVPRPRIAAEVVKHHFINGSNLWDIINKFSKNITKNSMFKEVLRMNFSRRFKVCKVHMKVGKRPWRDGTVLVGCLIMHRTLLGIWYS